VRAVNQYNFTFYSEVNLSLRIFQLSNIIIIQELHYTLFYAIFPFIFIIPHILKKSLLLERLKVFLFYKYIKK
jgi:hypothetical protein